MRRWRIAMVSEHASPLAMLGGVDAGGQNIHVAELAGALARRGHAVRVYTRRDDPDIAPVVPFGPGVDVEHVPAGPPTPLPKDELLPYMGEFGRYLAARWEADFTPAVVHAHFWMSGLAALTATAIRPIPVVVTYHALGSVKRRFQGEEDTSPPSRQGLERELGLLADRVIAQCGDEVEELGRMGIPRTHISVIPSGVNIERFTTGGPAAEPPAGGLQRVLTVGRLVPRKGYADLIRALPAMRDAELVIVGVTGALVRPRDIRQLAIALRAVLGNPVLRMSYASAAVDRVRSRYPWERTAAEMERVYAAVTGEPVVTGGALSEVSS